MVLDSLGLVLENRFLVVVIPALERALVFRVKARVNKGKEKLFYGPIPIKAGTTLPTFEGGTVTVPADGVLPARSYIPTDKALSFSAPNEIASRVYDSNDMWFTREEARDKLFHFHMYVKPAFLRVQVDIPKNVLQSVFQYNKKITMDIYMPFNWLRGHVEVVYLPETYYGFKFANELNVAVYTSVTFIYAEYLVDIPKDAKLIFNILMHKVPAHWYTLPYTIAEGTLEANLEKVYGFKGFPIPTTKEDLKKIEEELKRVKI